jgi:hypothetical protein
VNAQILFVKTIWQHDYEQVEVENEDGTFTKYDAEGCYAVAKIFVNGVGQKIRTAGTYGVIAPDKAKRIDVQDEQIKELEDILRQLGFKEGRNWYEKVSE